MSQTHMRRFAISDLHGCNRTFQALLETLRFDKNDVLYLLGDLVDRGPDSKGVIDTVWHLLKEGYTVRCLRGNHEQMMLNARTDPENRRHWMINGGGVAFESFEVPRLTDIPVNYFEWLENLPCYFDLDDYLLVHAGFDFQQPNPLSDTESMLWIRGWYKQIDHEWLGKRAIIHGHTPVDRKDIGLQLENLTRDRVLNIDNGCVFARNRPGLGHLCAFDLDEWKLYFQPNCESKSV
jgi:serine/threonine protein phosphatase 1